MYNRLGQLTEVYRDGERSCYSYRPDGLRHGKTVSKDGLTVTHLHLWDGQHIVGEIGANGTLVGRYIRGKGGVLVSAQIPETRRDCYQYYIYNARGDVIFRYGSDHIRYARYHYDAFGVQENPSKTDANPFRYCGEYFDKETKTLYLRNRSYNPSNGRFTQEDPVRDGNNWYYYCGNNPVLFKDPSGLCYYDKDGNWTHDNWEYTGGYERQEEPKKDYWQEFKEFSMSSPTKRGEKMQQAYHENEGNTAKQVAIAVLYLNESPGRFAEGMGDVYSALFYVRSTSQHVIEGSPELTPEINASYHQTADIWGNMTAGYVSGQVGNAAFKSYTKIAVDANPAPIHFSTEKVPAKSITSISELDDLLSDPSILKNYTPDELYAYLKQNGYDPQPLAKGSLKGIPFEDGGGYKVNWGGNRLLQYHPSGGGHHGGVEYYKISASGMVTKRYDMFGNEVE